MYKSRWNAHLDMYKSSIAALWPENDLRQQPDLPSKHRSIPSRPAVKNIAVLVQLNLVTPPSWSISCLRTWKTNSALGIAVSRKNLRMDIEEINTFFEISQIYIFPFEFRSIVPVAATGNVGSLQKAATSTLVLSSMLFALSALLELRSWSTEII